MLLPPPLGLLPDVATPPPRARSPSPPPPWIAIERQTMEPVEGASGLRTSSSSVQQKYKFGRPGSSTARIHRVQRCCTEVNDGQRHSSTLFPFVTQLNSPPRCSTTGPLKSWLQAVHCSAPRCCHVVVGRLTPMHLPIFVHWSLSRLEVIPDVLNTSSTSSSKKEAKKKIYLLRDADKFPEHNRLIGASATIHSTTVQLQKEHQFKKIYARGGSKMVM
ncbi:uncharacterized protein [Triticum aestivum]|uniref:uncharacterized protein n=1 Tax=Triticum aestivum TaxID=4565 RepID=UPI001D0177C5|nr:uncharacterized protein LOC123072279 [Triticum aestivum]